MTSRFLAAGLAAWMVVGLADEAMAQGGKRTARRPATAGAGATGDASDGASAPTGPTEASAKDPFDEAATTDRASAKEKAGRAAAGSAESPASSAPKLEKATFGAGCFWHVEAEFEWLPGVRSAVSGYAGGQVPNPSYEMVHEGDTGHIEVVQVEYDPAIISYEQLLRVFWHGHDPTQWNRQGPDIGTQYRSAVFYHNEAQRKSALKSYRELTAARAYPGPIVTLLLPMKAFYRAEEYHQNYYGGKPDRPVGRSTHPRRTRSTRKGAAAASRAAGSSGAPQAGPVDGREETPSPSPRRAGSGPSDALP